jgi:two-component system response regulator HupR/HoxA
LVSHFLKIYNEQNLCHVPYVAPAAMQAFQDYSWPGNVRELQNEIQRMVALSDEDRPLAAPLLSDAVRQAAHPSRNGHGNGHRPQLLKDRVEALERAAIDEALARHNGNISRVADELGLSRVGLRNKIERYDIPRDLRDAH